MAELVIRAPRKSDAAALARIWVDNCDYYAQMDPESFQVPKKEGLVEWFESFVSESGDDEDLSLVAEVEGRVVGSLDASILEPAEAADRQMIRELGERRLFVNAMGVDREYWRAGIGSALMGAAEQWARERGATCSGLDTYIRSPVSVPFYEKLGYKRQSIRFRKQL
jgi:GNAT superfamily N-acetyltransferase